jgi:hypothetical protein
MNNELAELPLGIRIDSSATGTLHQSLVRSTSWSILQVWKPTQIPQMDGRYTDKEDKQNEPLTLYSRRSIANSLTAFNNRGTKKPATSMLGPGH